MWHALTRRPCTDFSASCALHPPLRPQRRGRSHLILQAHVTALSPHSVTIDRAFPELGFPTCEVPFAYCVYALGNRMPAPIDLGPEDANAVDRQPGTTAPAHVAEAEGRHTDEFRGTKQEAIEWLRRCLERIRRARSVLYVGCGALGIRAYSTFLNIDRALIVYCQNTRPTSNRSTPRSR